MKKLQALNFPTFWLPQQENDQTLKNQKLIFLQPISEALVAREHQEVPLEMWFFLAQTYLHLRIYIFITWWSVSWYLTHATELACLTTTASLEEIPNSQGFIMKKKN